LWGLSFFLPAILFQMAKNPETLLKDKVLWDLKNLPNTYARKIQQVVIRGTPDILACINGHFVALELKRSPKESPDPLQTYEIRQIEKAGGQAYVVNPENWPRVLDALTILARAESLPKPHHGHTENPTGVRLAPVG